MKGQIRKLMRFDIAKDCNSEGKTWGSQRGPMESRQEVMESDVFAEAVLIKYILTETYSCKSTSLNDTKTHPL